MRWRNSKAQSSKVQANTRGEFAPRSARPAMCVVLCAALLSWTATAAFGQPSQTNLANESLQNLMNIRVTTVSNTEQKLSQTASAVFVITQQDIAESGATNIPDLLRMVPGMDVAQINANTWAISGRGFNARFANMLQVLVDGRSVYTDSFGGVFWDQLDMPLEDIERIEVIRGPGGSVWGGNSVNGVINIITKKASETQGAMVVGGGGTVQQGFATVQYGGRLGSKTDFRAFTKYFNMGHFPDFAGQDGGDGWHSLRGGFRSDSRLSSRDTLMLQGDLYSLREGEPTITLPSITSPAPIPVEDTVDVTGGFLQGVWKHVSSARSDTTLEVSYDQYKRHDVLRDDRGTLDIKFQHDFAWRNRQYVLWGGEYRRSMSQTNGGLLVSFVPADVNTNLYSGFIQDEVTLVPSRVKLTLGARLDHNYYSGFTLMPSARVAWIFNEHTTLWAAVSRAERTPAEQDVYRRVNLGWYPVPGGLPYLFSVIGNPNIKNEGLTAIEAGYRASLTSSLTFDLAAYYNRYDHQYTFETVPPFEEDTPAPPHIVIPYIDKNLMHGETHGFELAVNWQPVSRWTLSPGYAFERIHMHVDPGSTDVFSAPEAEGSSPKQSAQLRSHLRLWHGLAWDASAYFNDRLPALLVPSYTRVDTQLSWSFGESATVSFVGQNLAQDHHEEFVDTTGTARSTLVKRSAYVKFTARF